MYEIIISLTGLIMVILNYDEPILQAIWGLSLMIILELIKIRKSLEEKR